jgi:hypothetical protein
VDGSDVAASAVVATSAVVCSLGGVIDGLCRLTLVAVGPAPSSSLAAVVHGGGWLVAANAGGCGRLLEKSL